MTVSALVFDVFGTLLDWRSGITETFRAAGVAGDPEELADDWRARYRPILAEVNEGSRPWGNFDDDSFIRRVKGGLRYSDRDQEVRYTTYNWGVLSEVWSGTPVSIDQREI